MLREKFPEFCSSPSPPIEGNEGVGSSVGVQQCCPRARLPLGGQSGAPGGALCAHMPVVPPHLSPAAC